MQSNRQKIRVLLDQSQPGTPPVDEDDPPYEEMTVWIEQRDYSAGARHHGPAFEEMAAVSQLRWATWHAGRRAMKGGWPQTPEQFEAVCVEAFPVETESVDPTEPAPEAG